MSSSTNEKDFPEIQRDHSDEELQNCLKEPSMLSLMSADLNGANLDAVRESMLRSLSASPSGFLQDQILLDSLPLASKLMIESLEETENLLVSDSPNLVTTENVRSKINLWQSSLEPWHELLKHLQNLGLVPCVSVQKLLDSLPDVIKVLFSHCKRSESLYGSKFDDLRSQLTSLYRQTDVILDVFFSVLECNVNFDNEFANEKNSLNTVMDEIGDIAVLTNGMNMKTMINTWKAFAKLATVHESILKKSGSKEFLTRRCADIAEDIQKILAVGLQEKKDTNYERAIKCVGLLLKILGRLCTLYRGYCGSKLSNVLVQLLTKLYRYSPPFPSERFICMHSKISEWSKAHIVPAAVDLLNILLSETEFSKAFFRYAESEIKEPLCYHLLTLRIIDELTKGQQSDLSLWLQEKSNIIDVALANMNNCCQDILINEIPVRSAMIYGELVYSGIYEVTLKSLCQLISRITIQDFEAIEIALTKHLLNGEYWSSLLSCDCWTYLGRIASTELCYEHLSFLIKVRRSLITRKMSLEFVIISNLIGRLYKFLPDEMKYSLFREIEDYLDPCYVDPLRESLPPRAQQHLCQLSSNSAENNNLAENFKDLRCSPSLKNWNSLTYLLRTIGALGIPEDHRQAYIITIGSIWSFLASSISKTEGITREMLLELALLLFDCTRPDSSHNSTEDRLVASIYNSMLEISEHVPIQHRIRINIFLRDNLEPYVNESGQQSLAAITELFCYLIDIDDPWIRQEMFETYTEYIVKKSSVRLVDALSVGINQLPLVCQHMQLYLSNENIYNFTNYPTLMDYLRKLAKTSKERSTWHKCYEANFRQRDEKMPRLTVDRIDKRVDDICNEIKDIAKRKNELSDESMDKLRAVLLKLLETS